MDVLVIGGGPGGLYLSILLKASDPSRNVRVVERNGPADTFGWGVVFSDETLGGLEEADAPSFAAITRAFAHWSAIDVHFGGRLDHPTIRSGGHGFAGVARVELLQILTRRAEELGVACEFHREISPDELDARRASHDLVVAADGINSRTRERFAETFRPKLVPGTSPFIWLGTRQTFDAFTFIVVETDEGVFTVHAYRFDDETSTFIVETDEESFRRAGLAEQPVEESVRWCEELFDPWLGGHGLMTNKSEWIRFRTVTNETWAHENVVLIGDAAHTAHFSIGSGTKLALEDAIELAAAIETSPRDVPRALAAYEEARRLDVLKLQRAASHSQTWFEEMPRHVRLPPEQLAFSMLTRSKKLGRDNLRLRDPGYVRSVDRAFADRNGAKGADPIPPPMFCPFELRGMTLANRVVLSPMCQYSSSDGMPDDWHLVHLGSRAVGGAGLVMAEMTDVSEAARITPRCAGIYTDEHVAAWRRIVDFCHEHSDAKVGMQLGHAGRKGATRVMWEGIDQPLDDGAWEIISASPLPYFPHSQVPREISRDEMTDVLSHFVAATRRSAEAGFDLLEVHAAHGYLLASFLSPLTNRRGDEFGGTRSNRFRFPLEVVEAVRAEWPDDRPLSVRISAIDWIEGGTTIEDSVAFARELRALGVDVVDVSSGMTTPDSKPAIWGRMYQVPFADRIRSDAEVPVIAVGNIQDADHVNTILAAGRADLCALARPHLVDPYFTLHAAAAEGWPHVRWPDQYGPGRELAEA